MLRCIHNPEQGLLFLVPAERIDPVHKQRRIEAIRRLLHAQCGLDWRASPEAQRVVLEASAALLHVLPEDVFGDDALWPEYKEIEMNEAQLYEGRREFLQACQDGDADIVRAVLQQGLIADTTLSM